MEIFKYITLGLIQGIAEFLPISSSGHIVLFEKILDLNSDNNLGLAVIVHFATLISTLIVFRKRFIKLLKEGVKTKWNQEHSFILKILISTIPVALVGFFFKDQVEQLFDNNYLLLGLMFMTTAIVLFLTKSFTKDIKAISYQAAFLIGIAQAIALMPGISRSGMTIALALILGIKKDKATTFSFFMPIIPILGANLLELKDLFSQANNVNLVGLTLAFTTALISGIFACNLMIKIVKQKRLYWFSLYCLSIGIITLIFFRN